MNPLRVALVQVAAGTARAANLRRVARLLPRPGAADLVVLPEVFAVRGGDDDYRAAAEPLDGPLAQWVSSEARRLDAWVLAGGILEAARGGIYLTALLVDRRGRRRAAYRKIHLFEARLDDGRVIREADVYRAGRRPVVVDVEGWRCGLSICYDLRFPELYRLYAAAGAHLLLAPSNFTQRTGRDHWEVLVRARAIENQCFVAAAGQCGRNPRTGVRSHGHSMVVGPWGEVLAAAGDAARTVTATLDPALLDATRARVPALQHRRLCVPMGIRYAPRRPTPPAPT